MRSLNNECLHEDGYIDDLYENPCPDSRFYSAKYVAEIIFCPEKEKNTLAILVGRLA